MTATPTPHDSAVSAHVDRLREQGDPLADELAEVELGVLTEGYTLADAIREGSQVSEQSYNWGDEDTSCTLTAAYVAAKARGVLG